MGKFGWSYPPGAANDPLAPYNQTNEPIDLTQDKTLRGYGRKGHGLNGKDADLSAGGQNYVKSAYWFDDDRIEIEGERYATLSPGEEWREDQKDSAQEMVCDCGFMGEWDGDAWIISEEYHIKTKCKWNDMQTNEQNIDRALAAAYKAIRKDSRAFEREMTGLSRAFNEIDQDE